MLSNSRLADFRNPDREQVAKFISEKLPGWVTLALVVLIAWQLARIAWMLVPSDTDAPIVMPERAASNNQASANVAAIAAAHLFGAPPQTTDGEDTRPIRTGPDPNELPDARVSFALKGTVAASDTDNSVAIIAEKSRQAT